MIRRKDSEIELLEERLQPGLTYSRDFGCLDVRVLGCISREMNLHPSLSVSVAALRIKPEIVFFTLYGVKGMLFYQGYTRPFISLTDLLKRFKRYHKLPGGASVFGEYEKQIFAIARKHQFVWWI